MASEPHRVLDHALYDLYIVDYIDLVCPGGGHHDTTLPNDTWGTRSLTHTARVQARRTPKSGTTAAELMCIPQKGYTPATRSQLLSTPTCGCGGAVNLGVLGSNSVEAPCGPHVTLR